MRRTFLLVCVLIATPTVHNLPGGWAFVAGCAGLMAVVVWFVDGEARRHAWQQSYPGRIEAQNPSRPRIAMAVVLATWVALMSIPNGQDVGALVALGLARAVGRQLLPDYKLAVRDGSVVLRNSVDVSGLWSGRSRIPSGSLSAFHGSHIQLLSGAEIQRRADTRGDFGYLSVVSIKFNGPQATVVLATDMACGRRSRAIYLCGGGLEIWCYRTPWGWSFGRVVRSWIS